MSTQKALVMQGDGKASIVTDRPIATLRKGYVLVKVKAVALNPTDWKHIAGNNTPGALSGCDYAGVVEQTGVGYAKDWKVGDRICGMATGASSLELEDGAFAEHIVVKADIQLRIPDNLSFEQAATLGVGFLTCGQGLFQSLGLNLPDQPTNSRETVFIYGGSTAMGSLGIQLAKLAGYMVITTCSPRNFDMVKQRGADEVFDYNDPDCAEKIKTYTNSNLKLVWDTVGGPSPVALCATVIANSGQYSYLVPVKFPRDDIITELTAAYTATGEPIDKPFLKRADNSRDFHFAKKFTSITEKLLEQGKLIVHPPKVYQSGLDGVLDGLAMLRDGKVSGEKLVYVL